MINFQGKYSIYSANNPFIAVVDNLLPDDVIDDLAKDIDQYCDFERAMVVSEDGGSKEDYRRTNKVAKNSLDYNKSPAAAKFLHMASSLIRLHPAQAEPLQVVKYNLGEQYEPHSDCFTEETLATNRPEAGQRIATALLYLNDVVEGGYTSFPNMNISIEPRKGRAIFFTTTHTGTEKPLELANHGAEMVIRGEKTAVNLWFRTHVYHEELYQKMEEESANSYK
tara:strand:- start:2168 stop:2839 length:672 start_codon:yes stop_codon:yes gene_type:complete